MKNIVTPEEIKKTLIEWYEKDCYEDYTTNKCSNICPMWRYCERLSDLVEEIINEID